MSKRTRTIHGTMPITPNVSPQRLTVGALVSVLAIALVFVLTSLRASSAPADYSDLVLSYTFETIEGGTVRDASQYQYDGTITGATVAQGKHGNGLQFDGVDDAVRVPHATALSPTSAMTAEAWVYLNTTSTAMKILQKRGVFSDTSGGYLLGAWFGNPRGYAFEVYDTSNAQHLVYPQPERSPATQTWTHVAGTYDGSTLKLYENGQLVGSTVWSGTIGASTKELSIGIQPDNSLMPFKGILDDVKIYNRALSAEEVSCSYEGKVWHSGSCQSNVSRPPVVVSMTGSTSAATNASANWTVRTHDPDGGSLTYTIEWGDGGPPTVTTSTASATNDSQTLSHTYTTAGTYAPRVTVRDVTGQTGSLSADAITIAPPPDTAPPGIPTNLTAEETTSSSTRVAWLAPTDDVGVTSYQVRYRQGTSIADVDWAVATDAGTVASTVAAGQRVSTVLSNLAAGTSYGVGVKACDAAGNCSTIAALSFQTGAVASAGGLIGHWKFDGNGSNEVAGGPSATASGSAAFRSSGGKYSGYAYLAASGDSLRIRSTVDLPNAFTVALWFRQRADRGFLQDLVTKGSGRNNFSFRIFRQLWNQYNFGPIITGYTSVRTGYWVQTSNLNQLSHNEWHHVVFTKDATQSAYYLDGSLIHASAQTDPAVVTVDDVIVGGTAMDTDVDDLRMYNRGLSATEARELSGFPAPDTQAPNTPGGISVGDITHNGATLRWIVPTDNIGVTRYDIQYHNRSTVLTDADWGSSSHAFSIPTSSASGTAQSHPLTGLNTGTDYAVGMKACDAAGNCSAITSTTFRTQTSASTGTTTTPTTTASTATTATTSTTGGGGGTTTTTTTTTPTTTATTTTTTPTTTASTATTATTSTTATTTTTTPTTTASSAVTTTPTTTATTAVTTTTPVETATAVVTMPLPAATTSVAPTPRAQTTEERAAQLKAILQEAAQVFVRTLAELADIVGVDAGAPKIQEHKALVEKVVSEAVDKFVRERIESFVAVGTQTTQKLGAGERAGVVNSFREAFGHEPEDEGDWTDVVKIANGRFPSQRDLVREQEVRGTFFRIYRREADLGHPNDAAAIMTMAYGMRPEPRNVDAERAAITIFKRIFGRAPSTGSDWDAVRAIAYSGAKR